MESGWGVIPFEAEGKECGGVIFIGEGEAKNEAGHLKKKIKYIIAHQVVQR